MVNASTPAGYVDFQPLDLQLQGEELVTANGVISSQTDYLEFITSEGVKIGGKQTYSNIKLYGVNDTSTNNQDVEIYVDQGIEGQPNKGKLVFLLVPSVSTQIITSFV